MSSLNAVFAASPADERLPKQRACVGGISAPPSDAREHLAKQACQQPIAQEAAQAQVGPRFVQGWVVTLIEEHLAKEGRTVNETAKLPTPCILRIDEFARRKGHHYDTIVCDLVNRSVLEISVGR